MNQPSFDYNGPRCHKNPHDTEELCATAAAIHAPESCRRVYNYLARVWPGGRTDEELRDRLEMHSARRRRADLMNMGLIRDSGKRRMSAQGKPMIVWEVVR